MKFRNRISRFAQLWDAGDPWDSAESIWTDKPPLRSESAVPVGFVLLPVMGWPVANVALAAWQADLYHRAVEAARQSVQRRGKQRG